MRVDGFSESIFTTEGKRLFMEGDFLKLKVSSFSYSSAVGEIKGDRVNQTSVEIRKSITSGGIYQKELELEGAGAYTTEDNIGYVINTAVYAYEVANPFEVKEVGLYAIDSQTNKEVLVWVGRLDSPILYDPKIDVIVNIYVPITNKDIKVDLYTDPQRIREHDKDIESHKHLRELVENSKLFGFDEGEENKVVLNNSTWESNKFHQEYREPKMYMFEPSHTNTGATTFKEKGKKEHPLWYLGNVLTGGELEEGIAVTAVYKATPEPHFKLIRPDIKSDKRSVWRYTIKEDGEKFIPCKLIKETQDLNQVSINVQGIEVIDMKDFTLAKDGINTTWNTLKVGQRIRVEGLKVGQNVNQKWDTWRFEVTKAGQVDFPTYKILTTQDVASVSVNVKGIEVMDVSNCVISKDKFTLTNMNLVVGDRVKIDAMKENIWVDQDVKEVLTRQEAEERFVDNPTFTKKVTETLKALNTKLSNLNEKLAPFLEHVTNIVDDVVPNIVYKTSKQALKNGEALTSVGHKITLHKGDGTSESVTIPNPKAKLSGLGVVEKKHLSFSPNNVKSIYEEIHSMETGINSDLLKEDMEVGVSIWRHSTTSNGLEADKYYLNSNRFYTKVTIPKGILDDGMDGLHQSIIVPFSDRAYDTERNGEDGGQGSDHGWVQLTILTRRDNEGKAKISIYNEGTSFDNDAGSAIIDKNCFIGKITCEFYVRT